jgi:general secretion pathway protein G
MIELMVVISLIVILTTMGLTQYQHSVVYGRESVLKEDLFRLRDAIDQYFADKGQYPSTLDALVSDGYIRKIPDDPFTKSSSSWQTVPAEPDPNNPAAEAGVYDVKSGSEATALDGTKYADWDRHARRSPALSSAARPRWRSARGGTVKLRRLARKTRGRAGTVGVLPCRARVL